MLAYIKLSMTNTAVLKFNIANLDFCSPCLQHVKTEQVRYSSAVGVVNKIQLQFLASLCVCQGHLYMNAINLYIIFIAWHHIL